MRLKTESETGERRQKYGLSVFFSRLATYALGACEARALRARESLTDLFTDFEKKTGCFAVYASHEYWSHILSM